MTLEDASPEDLFGRCVRQRDQAAWREFHRRYHRTIASVAARLASKGPVRDAGETEELIQVVYLHFLEHGESILAGFARGAAGSDYGYVKVIAYNCACGALRRRKALKAPHEAIDDRTAPVSDPGGTALVERSAMIGQIESTLEAIANDRDRRIFWLYYRVGLTAGQIAGFPTMELSVKGVESVLKRLVNAVRERFAPPGTETGKGL